ncbi:MAG: ribosomal L7Ae/L30e/S12e/Gadd45 family protein [Synergistaceae bacterium]|nr:ribosomal L7Ae/L30e/S12e/Gadd45 family protein [Synergistaceae bacterium]
MNEAELAMENGEQTHRVLSLLGIARRAGELIFGQDQVIGALKKKKRLFIVWTADCSQAVIRKIEPLLEKRSISCVLKDVSRENLGRSLGVQCAQIAALPVEGGFAKKLTELLHSGGRCEYE